jgi:hypothetical protein
VVSQTVRTALLPLRYSLPMWFGRSVAAPINVRVALASVLEVSVDHVRVIENSLFARLHSCDHATTRRRCIYLRGSAADFFRNPALMLHEYCHVMKQWEPRRLTAWGYLTESLRRGYWNNRFEVEARAFAEAHRGRLETMLAEPTIERVRADLRGA